MTFLATAKLQHIGYPIQYPRCNNGNGMQLQRTCWTGTRGKVMTFLEGSSLWTKLGLARTNHIWSDNKNEWKHPGSPCPKKVRPTQSNVKAMFIVAYDIDGVILHHSVPQRQTLNAAYYCSFLHNHLCPALRRKWQHLLATNPIILHDNARAHTANVVTDLLHRWQWEKLEQLPYSPDMSPCDYDLFAKMNHCEVYVTTQERQLFVL